jgi:hypothetical protein
MIQQWSILNALTEGDELFQVRNSLLKKISMTSMRDEWACAIETIVQQENGSWLQVALNLVRDLN